MSIEDVMKAAIDLGEVQANAERQQRVRKAAAALVNHGSILIQTHDGHECRFCGGKVAAKTRNVMHAHDCPWDELRFALAQLPRT